MGLAELAMTPPHSTITLIHGTTSPTCMYCLLSRVKSPSSHQFHVSSSLVSTSINQSESDIHTGQNQSLHLSVPLQQSINSFKFSSTTLRSRNTRPIILRYGLRAMVAIMDLNSLSIYFIGDSKTFLETDGEFRRYFEEQNAIVAAGKGNGLLPIKLTTFGLGNGLTVSLYHSLVFYSSLYCQLTKVILPTGSSPTIPSICDLFSKQSLFVSSIFLVFP